MPSIDLSIYGVRIRVAGDDEEALRGIEAQFLGFGCARSDEPLSIDVSLRDLDALRGVHERMVADQIVDRGIVYNLGDTVFVDHHGRSASSYDFSRERGIVYARETADYIEQSYLMIHSRLGPMLEARGLTRIHACGFVVDGRAGLVLATSGGGKSRLALALLADPRVRLLGDDMVLLDAAGHALPFPHPIGVSDPSYAEGFHDVRRFVRRAYDDKWLIGGEQVLKRHASGKFPIRLLALLTRASAPPTRATPADRRAVLGALFRDTVVGLGLPQVLEMVARRGARDLVRVAPSLLPRTRRAVAVARSARPIHLEVHDPRQAAAVLVEELQR